LVAVIEGPLKIAVLALPKRMHPLFRLFYQVEIRHHQIPSSKIPNPPAADARDSTTRLWRFRSCYVEGAGLPAAFGSVEPPFSIGAGVNMLANDQRVRNGKTLRPSGKVYREERLRIASDQATEPGANVLWIPRFCQTGFRYNITRFGTTAPDEMGLDEAKEVRPASACCLSLPLPARTRRRVYGQLSQASPVVTYGETLEEAQANAREAIELCLEVMREDGQPIPPPDRDLASPIDQLVPVAAAHT